jgi:hypothetical protein
LQEFEAEFVDFQYHQKIKSFFECLRLIRTGRFDLFVLEGSGIAGGLAAIVGRILFRCRYAFSSGDAIAPYLSARWPLAGPIFNLYERVLCRCSDGFIGWTPYLVGRSLTLGARRGVTIPGWAPYACDPERLREERAKIRRRFHIPDDAVVFGLVGSLRWSKRIRYCYGAELIRAAGRAARSPYVLIVGDGTGLPFLKSLAGEALDRTIFLPGRIAREEVPYYLAAMDVGSLPQSLDGVGSFRYTTKISEYRLVSLPFVTNEIPMAYDLDRGDIWRLPGETPWSERFISSLAQLMQELTMAVVVTRKIAPEGSAEFNEPEQIRRATAFLQDVLSSFAAPPKT